MEATKIVLGLGNPGLRYRPTRHNLGFRVVEELARRRGCELRTRGELQSRVCCLELPAGAGLLILAQPRTYMNRSGRAAAALRLHYDASLRDLLVVHDDADLELGRIRIRSGGGAGGHNGIRSIMETLGSGEFPRIRLGVRGAEREERELAEYVLEPFHEEERVTVAVLVDLATEAVETLLRDGVDAAMNRFNGSRAEPHGPDDTEAN